MGTEQVETTQAGATATPAKVAGVETAAPAVPATPTTPASTPAPTKTYTEAELAAQRKEWQAAKDREVANLHKTHQQQLANAARQSKQNTRQQALGLMQQAGVKDTQVIGQMWDNYDLAELGRTVLDAQAQQAQWQNDVAQTAAAAGIDPAAHPEFYGATSFPQLAAMIAEAKAAEAKAAAEAARAAAEAEAQRLLQAKADGGGSDTLGASPAGAANLQAQYDKEKAGIKRGNIRGLTELNRKYRAKGLSV